VSTADRTRLTPEPPIINRVMDRLLRSRLSRLVDGGLMLLSVSGRRTGQTYTFPVQYVEDDGELWVYVGDEAAKTWWRNLVGGGDVEVLLRRRRRTGTARALLAAEDPRAVAAGLRRYVERFPGTAKRLGVPAGGPAALVAVVPSTVVVHIELDDVRGG
jgi:deazaflavin-dependent oxidoreductase (nitroreductase family)